MKTTRKTWTDEDNLRLRKLAEDHPSSQILARLFGVTVCSIHNRCVILGIKLHKAIPIHLSSDPLNLRKWLWLNRIKPKLVTTESGCMEWNGSHYRHGYGHIRVGNRLMQTHRISYEAAHGAVLTVSQFVCHRCDNPKCSNPDHLFTGSQSNNMQDMMNKGRNGGQYKKGYSHKIGTQVKGEKVHLSKLTEAHVLAARKRYGEGGIGYKLLAREYNVSPSTMQCVLKRKTWKHI